MKAQPHYHFEVKLNYFFFDNISKISININNIMDDNIKDDNIMDYEKQLMRQFLGDLVDTIEFAHLFKNDPEMGYYRTKDATNILDYILSKSVTHLHKCVVMTDKYDLINDYLNVYLKNCNNINAQCSEGWTALHYAVKKLVSVSSIRTVELLLEHNADINLRTRLGYAPIHLLIQVENYSTLDVLRLILAKNPELNLMLEGEKFNIMHLVGLHTDNPCSEEIAQELINYGVDLEELSDDGCSVLHYAVIFADNSNDFSFIRYLIKAGANVNTLTKTNRSIIHVALNNSCSVDLMRILIEAGADINLQTPLGYSPIVMAINEKNDAIVDLFLEYGCDAYALHNGKPIFDLLTEEQKHKVVINDLNKLITHEYCEICNKFTHVITCPKNHYKSCKQCILDEGITCCKYCYYDKKLSN